MEVCPVGFFCFDKNTFLLFIISLIIVVVYLINKNNIKFEKQKIKLENRKKDYVELKNELQSTKFKVEEIENNQNDELYVAQKDHQRIINPLYPPERSYPYKINKLGVAINVPTRGYSPGYQQVGALIQDGDDSTKKILPLYGTQTYPGSRQWMYYTGADNYSAVKLPIENKGRSCQGDQGCQEIYDGDTITVSGYSSDFKVNLYGLDKPRYIPYVF